MTLLNLYKLLKKNSGSFFNQYKRYRLPMLRRELEQLREKYKILKTQEEKDILQKEAQEIKTLIKFMN